MFAYFDNQSELFDTPFFAINKIMAERQFRMVLQKEDSMICQFKDNFDLYCLGTFEKETGKFESDLKVIINGKQVNNGGEKQ